MIVGIAMVRDEEDIIDWTVKHLLAEGVDHIVIADNLSADRTRDILDAFPTSHVTVLDDPDPAYRQSEKMSALAQIAGDMGADWVLPFDADELFYSSHGTIAEVLNSDACKGVDVIKAWGWDHVPPAIGSGRAEPREGNPWRRFTQRRPDTQKLPKVAFRYSPDARLHMGNHDVDRAGHREDWVLSYRHLAFRSFGQMKRKYRNGKQAYDASNLDYMYGTHWREGGAKSDDELRVEWDERCNETGLVYDPPPYRGA